MPLREWVRLPSEWIEDGGLCEFRWRGGESHGADYTAALMVLTAIAHQADDDSGKTRLTYDQLCLITGLSRAKVAAGLSILDKSEIVRRTLDGRSTFELRDYDPRGGWCKFPARRLYADGRVLAFADFKLRSATELHALKLYFLFAARRGNDTNMAHISYEKIQDYSGIEPHRIRAALSLLAVIGLVHVERIPSALNDYGIANAYRLSYLDPRVHMGTRGRRMEAFG